MEVANYRYSLVLKHTGNTVVSHLSTQVGENYDKHPDVSRLGLIKINVTPPSRVLYY